MNFLGKMHFHFVDLMKLWEGLAYTVDALLGLI